MSLQDFEYGRVLGKGVFGSVLIVKRKEDKEIYAMKRVKIGGLTKKELENSFNEVRLLASLNHKNVIGYREAFYDQKSKTLNIVMEYADDGDLSSKIKQYIKKQMFFDEKTIWSTLIQILEGLKYLHKSYIIHRDLKSANIFLTKKGEVKIGDLNVSKIIGKNMAITQTGTPYYASPEIWNDHPYDYKCDIWSAGCIIYEMAALKMPFRGTSMQMLYNKVMKGIFDPIPSRYSNDLMEIIKLILTKNPHKRPSAEDLLKHKIILEKMEIIGLEKNIWNYEDEKALLIRTIKLPRNINQMNQINMQLPRKNYKKDRYLNEMEMFENDEYETAKNSFYHKNDKNNNKKKNLNNLHSLNTRKDLCSEPKKIKPLLEKKYRENESNATDIDSNKNYSINKYNYYYNYNINFNGDILRSKSNLNNNKNNSRKIIITNNNNFINQFGYQKEKITQKKINNYGINKRENIFSPQNKISQNKKIINKNPTTEYLRISTSNIFTSEGEKACKIQTSVNEPIKLIQNSNIKNSINNIFKKNGEKNKYIPISSLNNGASFINNIFECQINKILNKKNNKPDSISSIQQKSRQRQNKYMPNPSFDNILKSKKTKTLDSQNIKIIQNKSKYNYINITNNNSKKTNNKEIFRNRSCKGIVYNNSIFKEENLVEEKLQKKKKKIKKNTVRRNASTDFLKKKNSFNYNENIYKNQSQLISNNINISKENLSNNNRVKRIKKQLEDILPSFEFEKIFKNRLPSANNGINRNKNNVNVKININNNYNYINNLNINNNNHKLNVENQYQLFSKNNRNKQNLNNNDDYFDNNRKPSRPRSTSTLKINEKVNNKHNFRPPPMIKISNSHKKENINNLTDINNNYNNKENSNKKYKEFFNFYYQKFMQDKLRNLNNNNNYPKNIHYNQNNELIGNINYNKENRKVTYEKIKILQNKGEERKYIKGPSIVRCIGEGNIHNQCHRAIFKYQNMLNNINDYSIQNLNNKDFKDEKIGPRIILPKKMMILN